MPEKVNLEGKRLILTRGLEISGPGWLVQRPQQEKSAQLMGVRKQRAESGQGNRREELGTGVVPKEPTQRHPEV